MTGYRLPCRKSRRTIEGEQDEIRIGPKEHSQHHQGDGLWVFGVPLDADKVAGELEDPLFAQDIVERIDGELASDVSSLDPQ